MYKTITKRILISKNRVRLPFEPSYRFSNTETNKKWYYCNKCSYSTTKISKHKKHLKKEHKEILFIKKDKKTNIKKLHKCKLCEFKHDNIKKIKEHIKKIHKKYYKTLSKGIK